MYCKNCGNPVEPNQEVCLKCGVKVGNGNAYCPQCGNEVLPNAEVCINCGVKLNSQPGGYLNGHDKIVMAVLCFFLGGLGIHNFILGETKKGVLKIVLSLCFGIGAILALIDFVRILIDKYEVNPDKFF